MSWVYPFRLCYIFWFSWCAVGPFPQAQIFAVATDFIFCEGVRPFLTSTKKTTKSILIYWMVPYRMAPYKYSTVPVNYGPKNMITLRTYVDTDNVSFIQLFYWKRLEDCISLLFFAVCKNEYVYHRIITMNCI